MKTLVVYFSRTGHTARIAKEIARRCEADIDAVQVVDWGRSPQPAATYCAGSIAQLQAAPSWQPDLEGRRHGGQTAFVP